MARSFSGSDDIATSSVDTFNGDSAVTVSAWVKRDASVTDFSGIAAHRDAGAVSTNLDWDLGVRSTNVVRVGIHTTTGFQSLDGVTALGNGVWEHVLLWWDGTNLKIYLNAVQDATAGQIGTLDNGPHTIHIGRNIADSVTFSGDIAEVAAWKGVALNAGEREALAARFSPALIRPGSLQYHWELRGRQSPEIELMEGLNGTLTGTAFEDHPAIINPAPPQIITAPAAAGKGAGPFTELSVMALPGIIHSFLAKDPAGAPAEIFFENRHPISQGMKPSTAAGLSGVLIDD